MKQNLTLEESMLALQKKSKAMSVEDILYILSDKGPVLILLFLSLPFCQPLQIPGLSTPFGLVIAVIGLRIAFGKRTWLPQKLLKKKIKPRTMQKITRNMLWWIKKMKRWTHPRWMWWRHYKVLHGLFVAILGFLLALPLPIPFSNLMVAWSIFFIGLGMLEEDGVFVLAGYLVALVFLSAMFLSITLIF